MRHPSQGFTLIELLITIAIAATLMAIAIPSFSDWLIKTRVKGAAEEIQSTLSYARSESIKQNKETCLTITDKNSSTWQLAITANCSNSTIYRLISANEFNNAITLTIDNTSKIDKTRFTPRSQRPGFNNNDITVKTTQSMSIAGGNYQLRINLTPTGLISICSNGTSSIGGYVTCA
ncbi:GspH/FimT family pseudopilin [uncultured Deefgea sp.]|uniref:GspH/FimT family pseudopilin n=1 Tax=uncultured Deefgea sp. TaxID=1304914 RepID=UPI002606B9B4|nr:GspH/FimT family pseudopilin [uncultured Deefgea sp.]